MSARRIVALVFPELLCEVASEALLAETKPRSSSVPLAVVLNTEGTPVRLAAVNRTARQFGVSVGQTVVEANAFLAQLVVRTVSLDNVMSALACVAEVAMGFGNTVSLEADEALASGRVPDTVWIDITGAAHLKGGEQALAEELAEQVRVLGYEVRVAVASGKYLAQAFARWARPPKGQVALCVPAEQTRELFAELPLLALPLDRERRAWLMRLGLLTVADLVALPRKAAVSRLGPEAEKILDLCAGKDEAPLVAFQPARQLVEERFWEEPVQGSEPLNFVLRGLASRMSARLVGRGEAAQVSNLTIVLDRSIAELRQVPKQIDVCFELAEPLWRERDLLKVMSSRLERLTLPAPSVGVRWVVPKITRAVQQQLDLSRVSAGSFAATRGLEALPILLAELNADIGKDKLGVLAVNDDHRPELQSLLLPALATDTGRKPARHTRHGKQRARPRAVSASDSKPPLRKACEPVQKAAQPLGSSTTRLLPTPLRLAAPLKLGKVISLGHSLYSIEALSFVRRLDAVQWWVNPVSRDYFKVLLRGPRSVLEALVYVERDSGKRYLQAIID